MLQIKRRSGCKTNRTEQSRHASLNRNTVVREKNLKLYLKFDWYCAIYFRLSYTALCWTVNKRETKKINLCEMSVIKNFMEHRVRNVQILR